MASRAGFAVGNGRDRTAVLACTVAVVAVIAGGFAYDMIAFHKWNPLGYRWYVHVHAIAFSAWLILLAAQVALVRSGNVALHRRVGKLAMVVLPLMLISGPLVAILKNHDRAVPNPVALTFMGTQFTNVLGCVVLLTAGLLLRRDAAAHKRLMLMGTIAITEPGFGRLIADPLEAALGQGYLAHYVATYVGTLLLMLAVGGYDLWTRGRLHPAWVVAFFWVLASQMLGTWLYYQNGFWLNWMRALTGS